MFKRVLDYCRNSYEELVNKVTWPSAPQLAGSAMVVLYASLLIALVVFAMDSVFENFMELIYPN